MKFSKTLIVGFAIFLASITLMADKTLAQSVFPVMGGRSAASAKMGAQISQLKNVNNNQQTAIDSNTNRLDNEVKPHAKVTLAACSASGLKIRWSGAVWTCVLEDDPTVEAFAQTALPSCNAGEVLSANGTGFSCVSSVGGSFEVDPQVGVTINTKWCRADGSAVQCDKTLPNCPAGQVLTGNGTNLSCVSDTSGGFVEVDPNVEAFAKNLLPTCAAGQVLTGNGTNLSCVNDTAGGFAEVDPSVQAFAKNVLPSCPAGQVLTGNGTSLSCIADTSGGFTEVDPQVGTLTNGKWCTTNGTTVNCTTNAPVGDNLGNHTATADLNMGNKSIRLGTSNLQTIYGDNATALYLDSNDSNTTQLILRDKENLIYGRLYGSGNGVNFGLLDGNGTWNYLAVKNVRTDLRISNVTEMQIKPTTINMMANRVIGVGAPVAGTDAATKAYVDAAGGGGGITAVTTLNCTTGGSCTVTCPATYFRTGCSGRTNSSAGNWLPSGTNACVANAGGGSTTIYLYCAK